MSAFRIRTLEILLACAAGLTFWLSQASTCRGDVPAAVLNHVFPAGGQVGTEFEISVAGSGLEGLTTLQCSHPGIGFKLIEASRFLVTIPDDLPPGQYDLRTIGQNGLSSPRTFCCGTYAEQSESEPNDDAAKLKALSTNRTINGRIGSGGDLDHFRFSARRGERILIECWAERIDSPLRAVLELYDDNGRRLRVNRGYFGLDPLIEFVVPADGDYVVRLFDLVYSGSEDHVYRLDFGNGPRGAFAVPAIVERNRPTPVALYGWNLNSQDSGHAATDDAAPSGFERLDVEVQIPDDEEADIRNVRLEPAQATLDTYPYQLPGSHVPVMLAATDLPVVDEVSIAASGDLPQQVPVPCAISGQLLAGDERDVYAFEAKRGEVLWIDGFGERINSPVDLDVSILGVDAETELARFSDQVRNIGGARFPTAHLDPSGPWVVPADGRYFLMVRNLIGGLDADSRRVYALTIRRQEPDFDVVVVSRGDGPASLNVQQDGRLLVDLLAVRHRGMTGSIRVRARNLPAGIDCPAVWLGSGVETAPLVISAGPGQSKNITSLDLVADAPNVGERGVRFGTSVRAGTPGGWGRLTADGPLAVVGSSAPLRITADGNEPRPHHLYGDLPVRHAPGGILDVAVHIERTDPEHQAEVKLIGTGVPPGIHNQTASIPAGQSKGYISFYLPQGLAPGQYSLAVRAETTVPDPGNENSPKTIAVFSNVVSFEVHSPAFVVEVDPYAPKTIHRGEVIQVNYTARRVNGFIGKIHTELAAPVEVAGIRGRGVTFVGQTDAGTIQIVANDDAQFGQQPFLRLWAVGTVEDEPIYQGSCFLDLKIVE